MEQIDIPGLAAYERAFQVTDGSIVVVGITRKDETDRAVALKVRVRLADATGATVTDSEGVPFVAPAQVRSIATTALAAGTITVADVMAEATTDAVDRLKRHVAARRAWAQIPPDPDM